MHFCYRYLKNIKTASRLFKDRPQKPIETAVWWMEYVMRNKDDANVLRPILSAQQWWFQRRLLDVWCFVALILFLSLFLTIRSFKIVLSFCCGKQEAKVNKTKTKAKKQ
jgi:glucuronosyltransferase